MKILVTGATGYIGGRLVPRLLEAGHTVRCLVRKPESLSGRAWTQPGQAVEIVAGDALKPETLATCFDGVAVAYYLIHSMRGGESGFEDRDREAARHFATAARAAGVRKIIYLGGLGDDTQTDNRLSEHLQSRHEVGDILRAAGVPVTEFRAAIIVGSGSVSFEMIRYLTERLPVMICPKWVNSRCQPIAVRDVLRYLVRAATEPRCEGRILDIGGADVLSYRDMMLGYARVRGLRRHILPVPLLTPRLSSYWVDFITPIPASLARPLIAGLANDVVCRNAEARAIFDFAPLSYEEAVRLALQRTEKGALETAWSDTESSLPTGKARDAFTGNREGLIYERRERNVAASAARVFATVCSLGGDTGWLYANALWKLRAVIDRLLGGVGMRRKRRDSKALRVGDAVDFWRVEDVQAQRRLRLRAEMKVPGRAWLQFDIEESDTPHQSRLVQTAFFEPKGLAGVLYWWGLYPMHALIFSGLAKAIARRAERV